MQSRNLPIGYWIKQADELLTKAINNIQSSFNLSRLEWQILNTIQQHTEVAKEDIEKALAIFADGVVIQDVLSKFKSEGLVGAKDEHFYYLTEKGAALHEQCSQVQQEFRKKSMSGISSEEYEVTVATLQKIIENIKADKNNSI